MAPKVTTAEEAVVADGGHHTLLMRLRNGTEHELTSANEGPQYQVSTFVQSELPLEDIGTQEDAHIGHNDTPILAMSNRVLYEHTKGPRGKPYLIELHKRFAYPAACLVLMLMGIPLGLSSRRGGKSAGFVVTIALVFIYYFLSSTRCFWRTRRQSAGVCRCSGRPICCLPSLGFCCCSKWRRCGTLTTQFAAFFCSAGLKLRPC